MVKKTFLISLIALSLSLTGNPLFANEALQTKTGKLAADFKLLDLENKEVSLSSLEGRGRVLFFWTTWCPYCRQELKNLSDMYKDFRKEGIELLAINIGEPHDKVDNFVKKNNLAFRVFLDTDMAVAESYAILGVPTYILIDKTGYIVFEDHYFPQKEYKDLILK